VHQPQPEQHLLGCVPAREIGGGDQHQQRGAPGVDHEVPLAAVDLATALANILRTDRAAHWMLPADSELARAVAVLARAQQEAVWDRTQAHNKLRSLLREYYPALLTAFADKRDGIMRPEARTILAAVPTPTAAAKLTRAQLRALLTRAGRKRGIEAEADRLHRLFRAGYLHQPLLVEDAFGRQALALLRQLDAACINAEDLGAAGWPLLRCTRTPRHYQFPRAWITYRCPGARRDRGLSGPASPIQDH
jgi:Transposase